MMLHRNFVSITLLLIFVSAAVLADTADISLATRQAVASYCEADSSGWVADRWSKIKFSSKRKAERKYREVTDSNVFELGDYYPFIVVADYNIRDVQVINSSQATAQVAYRRVARSEGKAGGGWHLVADRQDEEQVTLNLIFDKNQWWVLDPPPPRVSKEVLINYYEYRVNSNLSRWDQELIDPQYDEEQKANIRASRDQAVGALRILKSLP